MGVDLIDENFNQNFYHARGNGFLRGAYHFFSPVTDPVKQAKHYCRIVQLDPDDIAPILDVESRGGLTPLDLHPFDRLNRRIAAVNQAEIYPVSLMPFLAFLESFGLETIGDVQRFIDDNSEDAYQLALSQLAITDLDILSSSVGLLNLCLVFKLKHDGGRDGLKALYDTINGENDTNSMLADFLLKQAESLPFMNLEQFIKFDYEITLLTVTQKNGPTLFCAPTGFESRMMRMAKRS